MTDLQATKRLFESPANRLTLGQPGDWFRVPELDPVTAYIEETFWDYPDPPKRWEIARLSGAVYLYREVQQGWQLVVKFYSEKTGIEAPKYAAREYQHTQQAYAACCHDPGLRVIEPLGVYNGALFLTYAPGLTLGDLIAVRRSQPGRLLPALSHTATFLATLHTQTARHDETPDFDDAYQYFLKIVNNLARYGVLQDNPTVIEGLTRVASRWADDPTMTAFTPALIHGDATTTNFVTPDHDTLITIDWERAKLYDPAADVGRLLAEVAHAITQQGGTYNEALPLLEHIQKTYIEARAAAIDREATLKRVRFHRASSTLRIARNGWLSRLERTALVAEALALLSI